MRRTMNRSIALLGLVVVRTATATRFLRGLAAAGPANVTAANYTRCVFQMVEGAACHKVDEHEQHVFGATYQSRDEAFALCDADPKCDAVQKRDARHHDRKNTVYQRCSLGKDACDRVRLHRNRRGTCGEYGDGCHGDDVFTCLPYDEAPARRSAGLFALCLVATLIFCALILYALYRAFSACLEAVEVTDDTCCDTIGNAFYSREDFGHECRSCCSLAALLFFWFLMCAFLASYYGPAHEHSSHGACDPRVQPWGTHWIAIVVCGGIATGIWCCLLFGGCDRPVSAASVSAAPSSRPPLYIACSWGHVGEARLLLENGAEVDQADKDGKTPLLIACQNGHVDAARLLLEKGAAVDRANKYGQTPLYIACSWGHVEAARLLLENGAEVDQADKDGATPLFAACENGRVDAARLLLNKGADVNRANKNGATTLYVACEKGHVNAARLLLDKGADVNRATNNGTTPLFAACFNGHVNAARLLLDKGAEVNRATKNGTTPLFAACLNGHVNAARLLLDKGADVNRANKNGRTPLYVACWRGHVDAARLLLDKGAEVDRANQDGETALSIAKYQGHSAVVALLEESRPLPLGKPRPQRQQSDVQCSICLGPYKERAWTKCNHSFCRECITEVCRTNPPTNRAPCPFCRRPVLLGELTRLETTPMLANEAAQPVRDPQPESGVDAALGDAFTSQGRTNTISS